MGKFGSVGFEALTSGCLGLWERRGQGSTKWLFIHFGDDALYLAIYWKEDTRLMA